MSRRQDEIEPISASGSASDNASKDSLNSSLSRENAGQVEIENTAPGTLENSGTTEKSADSTASMHEAGYVAAERSLLGIFTDVQNGMAKTFRERTQHLGLSRSQWRVLSTLSGRPGSTQTELAELIGIGRAPLGKIVDRLESQSWLERRSDPHDRRVNRLYLTRDVRPIVEPTNRISNQVVQDLLADLSTAEQEVFVRSLKSMHRKLGFTNQSTNT